MLERFGETLFLGPEDADDIVLFERQLRVGVAHQPRQLRHQLVEEWRCLPELVTVTDRATDDAPEHVTATLVARNDAIDDQECAGSDVIGDHAQRRRRKIARVGCRRRRADERLEQVDLVIAVHVLQDSGEAFKAHPGVDARLWQRRKRALGVAVELHEHQVPDLDVAIAVGVRRARRSASDLRTVIVENLAAWATWTRIRHLPEIVGGVRSALVVTNAHDALRRHADFSGPDIGGFVVGLIDSDPELFRRYSVDFGQQFPRVSDRITLEVIAERPVAEHLEERVMARGIADVLEVIVLAARAKTALDVRRADITTLIGAEKDILELHHAAVGEQQCRIVGRNERRRRNDRVPIRREVLEKFAADVGGFHAGAKLGEVVRIKVRWSEKASDSLLIQYVSTCHPDLMRLFWWTAQ